MKKYCLILIFLIISLSLFARTNKGFQFLNIDPFPYTSGMAGAFCAGSDKIESINFNPSGLADLNGDVSYAAYSRQWNKITIVDFAYAFPFKKKLSFGVDIFSLRINNIERTYINPNNPLDIIPSNSFYSNDELNFGLTGAYKFENDWSAGLKVNFYRSKLDNYSVNGLAYTLGVQKRMNEITNLGLSINNFGKSENYVNHIKTRLPTLYKTGVNVKLEKLFTNAYLDLIYDDRKDFTYRVGLSFKPISMLSLQIGYNPDYDAGAGVNLGFTISSELLKLDYSFTPSDIKGAIHKIGIGMNFGKYLGHEREGMPKFREVTPTPKVELSKEPKEKIFKSDERAVIQAVPEKEIITPPTKPEKEDMTPELQIDKEDVPKLLKLGEFYEQQGDHDEALKFYNKALEYLEK